MKKYKLAGEDEHMFHVQHPDGSVFGIAKSAVGPGVHKQIKALEPIKMADGGEVPEIDSEMSDKKPDYSLKDEALKIEPAPEIDDQRAPAASQEPLQIEPAEQTLPIAPDSNIPVAPQPQQPAMPGNMSDAYANAFAQKEAGITDIGKAQSEAAEAQSKAYEAQAQQAADIQKRYQEQHAQIDAEHKQLTDAVMNDKIDPHRLFSNMGTGNKVLAAIGIALSGIGSGLTGQQNMAMGVIQKSIERDIEAQKMELGKKHTLLSENLHRYGDLNTATQATTLQMNAITQAKVAQLAARSGSVQAQAQAKMMLGDLGMQAAQIKQQMAMRQSAMQGGGDPSGLVPYIVPQQHQKAVFDEIQRAQDTRRMGDTILKSFDQAAKDNTVLKTGAGFLRTPATVLALHQSMQPTFKDLEGTVRQAAMDNTFKNITPMPGDVESTIKTKRAALEDYLKSKMSAPTAKGFGIDLDKFGTTSTSRPETKTVGGITYTRGPNGQAIPVR